MDFFMQSTKPADADNARGGAADLPWWFLGFGGTPDTPATWPLSRFSDGSCGSDSRSTTSRKNDYDRSPRIPPNTKPGVNNAAVGEGHVATANWPRRLYAEVPAPDIKVLFESCTVNKEKEMIEDWIESFERQPPRQPERRSPLAARPLAEIAQYQPTLLWEKSASEKARLGSLGGKGGLQRAKTADEECWRDLDCKDSVLEGSDNVPRGRRGANSGVLVRDHSRSQTHGGGLMFGLDVELDDEEDTSAQIVDSREHWRRLQERAAWDSAPPGTSSRSIKNQQSEGYTRQVPVFPGSLTHSQEFSRADVGAESKRRGGKGGKKVPVTWSSMPPRTVAKEKAITASNKPNIVLPAGASCPLGEIAHEYCIEDWVEEEDSLSPGSPQWQSGALPLEWQGGAMGAQGEEGMRGRLGAWKLKSRLSISVEEMGEEDEGRDASIGRKSSLMAQLRRSMTPTPSSEVNRKDRGFGDGRREMRKGGSVKERRGRSRSASMSVNTTLSGQRQLTRKDSRQVQRNPYAEVVPHSWKADDGKARRSTSDCAKTKPVRKSNINRKDYEGAERRISSSCHSEMQTQESCLRLPSPVVMVCSRKASTPSSKRHDQQQPRSDLHRTSSLFSSGDKFSAVLALKKKSGEWMKSRRKTILSRGSSIDSKTVEKIPEFGNWEMNAAGGMMTFSKEFKREIIKRKEELMQH